MVTDAGRKPTLVVDEAGLAARAAASARPGHLVAAIVNGVMLWVSHQLLAWGWPAFLTDDFERLLPIVTASFVASILVELLQVVWPTWSLKRMADVVTSGFAIAVGLRTWSVFPFDFTGYARDWSSLVRVVIVAAVVATAIALVVNLVRLVIGPGAADRPRRR